MKDKINNLTAAKKALLIVGATFLVASATNAVQNNEVKQPSKAEAPQSVSLPKTETKEINETQSLGYSVVTQENASLATGVNTVVQEGSNGEKTVIYKVTVTDGKETSRELVSEVVTKQPVNKIIHKGTYVAPPPKPVLNCDPNYTPCVPNVAYDLDCPDIGHSVRVIGSDPHRFDGDNDGYGCESY